MRRLVVIILLLLTWIGKLAAQTIDCNIQLSIGEINSSRYPKFDLQWNQGCFSSVGSIEIQESIGDDQHFETIATITDNVYSTLYDRQYGRTYYYRVYYPEANQYSSIVSATPISKQFRSFLLGAFPVTVNENETLNVEEAKKATGKMDMPNLRFDWTDIRGIEYFMNLDSIIIDDNYIYYFPLKADLYSENTPPFISVNNTFLTFSDFIGIEGSYVYNDFHYKNFRKIRTYVNEKNYASRPGFIVGGAPTFIIAKPGDNIVATLAQHQSSQSFHPGNQYRWYKDSVYLVTTNSITFTLTNSASSADNGYYYCEITNPDFPKVTLNADGVLLLVADDPDNLPTESVNDSIVNQYLKKYSQNALYTSDGKLIKNALKPLKYISMDYSLNDDQKKALRDLSFLDRAYNAEVITITNTGAEFVPSLSRLTQLREVNLSNNKLTTVPSLENNVALSLVDVSNNRLTFEDLYPLKDLKPRYMKLFPQKAFSNSAKLIADYGDTVTFDLGIQNPLASNIYEWFKNGVSVGKTSEGKLVINKIKSSDIGNYKCIITNTEFPGKTISSDIYSLTTSDGYVIENYYIRDTAFAAWLDENFEGLIENGAILKVSKAAEIEELHIGETNIKNLDGLQYFYFLQEFTCNSKIHKVPDLSGLEFLKKFEATNANLSFTYQLALKNLNLDSLIIKNSTFSVGIEGNYNNIPGAFLFNPGAGIEIKSTSLEDIHPQSVFQWFKNSEPIIAQTNDNLLIYNFAREDVGYYSAIVTNPLFPGDTLQIGEDFGLLIAVDGLPDWWPVTYTNSSGGVGDHFMAYPNSPYLSEGAIEPGDMVGVFYEDETGELRTNAVGIWTGYNLSVSGIILGGDSDGVAPKTGFEESEPLKYKLWDPIRATNYEVQPEYAPVEEEINILLASEYYKGIAQGIQENHYYNLTFFNDGLFHPGSHSSSEENSEKLNWSWSVVVNWTGKNIVPWEAVSGGPESHLIIIPSDVSSDIQGNILETGDYIGFFFENELGELTCSDFVGWTGENTVISPWISNSFPKNGFEQDEALKMKIWKKNTKTEYLVDSIIFYDQSPFDASGLFKANGLSKVKAIVVNKSLASQKITLYPGWNLISSYLIPKDVQMSKVLDGISPVIVKNDRGDVVYAPQNGISTGNWDYKQGYQVYVLAVDTFSIKGTAVTDASTINIAQNTYPYFLPFWHQQPVTVAKAMGSLAEKFDYVQQVKYDAAQKRFVANNYIPSHIINPPIDQIMNMEVGLAYKVKMNQGAQYVFQKVDKVNGSDSRRIAKLNNEPVYYQDINQKSSENTIVVISSGTLNNLNGLNVGDEIAVKSPLGTVMGAGVFSGESLAVTAWDVNGISVGDLLTIEAWHAESNQTETLEITSANQNGYHPGELIIVASLKGAAEKLPELSEIGKFNIYPNPAIGKVKMSLPFNNGEKGVVSLMDLTGKIIISKEITVLDNVELDICGIRKGIYILDVRINTTENVWSEKKSVVITE